MGSAITASICGVVVIGYCALATGEHRNHAIITSQYDLGCVANHLGASPENLGKVQDCEVTKQGMRYGFDQLFLKFAYAHPAAMVKPAGVRGASHAQMKDLASVKGNGVPSQMIPVRARTG